MSNDTFPVLPGLMWDSEMTPVLSTQVVEAASGVEARAGRRPYPRWRFLVSFEILDGGDPAELQQLLGFFCRHGGARESWLYRHPRFNTCVNQGLGTAPGGVPAFQLRRAFGGFSEPVRAPDQVSAVRLDGVMVPRSGWSVSNRGVITFDQAPAAGAAITADFTYFFRCRFLQDESMVSEFSYRLYECQSLDFISVVR
jgi:uncharacterized protein (TIGR02217 family)